jgi:multiple antibiotic resistance protein
MHTLSHFWELILATVIALLPIINPLAATPVLLAITEGDSEARRRSQVTRGCLYMIGILVAFLFGGTFIMNFFGISVPGMRIAGGLLVSGIALSMFAGPKKDHPEEQRRRAEARAKPDISFSPLAMPMLSGPGSIAVTIGLASLAKHWTDYAAIVAGIMIVAAISHVVLSLSGRIVGIIGANGMHALTKIMGFLLLCIGTQFIVNGVSDAATDPELLRALREAWNQ